MRLFVIAALSLACASAGGALGAGLALAGGLTPEFAVFASIPAAGAASYVGWRSVVPNMVGAPRRRHV